MNKVLLIGRCTKDTEKRGSEKVIGVNTLAVNGYGDHTDFIDLCFSGKLADVAEKYLKKGTKVALEGSINVSQYKDKDGNNRTSVKVFVSNIEFVESKKATDVSGAFTE